MGLVELNARTKACAALAALLATCTLSGCATERSDWARAQKQDSPAAYAEFLKKRPTSSFAAVAKARLDTLEFQAADRAGDSASYEAYLKVHPAGAHRAQAANKLGALRFDEAEKKGTLEAWASFLKTAPPPELASKARHRRQDLLLGFHMTPVGAEMKRVVKLTGMTGEWRVTDPGKSTGVTIDVQFQRGKPLKSKFELATHRFALKYSSAGKTERIPCLGMAIMGASGFWLFNDLAEGSSFTVTMQPEAFKDPKGQTHTLLFTAPKDATDVILMFDEEIISDGLKIAPLP